MWLWVPLTRLAIVTKIVLQRFKYLVLLILGVAAFAACNLVDEDLRDCETDYHIEYELRLVTDLSVELRTELSLDTDVSVAESLESYFKDIFSDHAKDVDLSFYDVQGDYVRLHHEAHIMNASQSSYTLYIPVRQYMHLAVANLKDNTFLSLKEDEHCPTSRISQQVRDTVPSQRAGLFTARLPMDVKENVDQEFDVRLYMANCAATLVVDTLDSHIKDMKVFMTGFATGFDIRDSLYRFDYTPVVIGDPVPMLKPGYQSFASVSFPSRNDEETKATSSSLWQITIYATISDGSVTKTVLGISDPLPAGHVKVVQAKAQDNGQVAPGDPTIGVSVTMDWEAGLEGEIPL